MTTNHENDDDQLAALLKQSGGREKIPEEITKRVDTAAYEYWLASVGCGRRENRWRKLHYTIGFTIAASVLWFVVTPSVNELPVPRAGETTVVMGNVEIMLHDGRLLPLNSGNQLNVNDVVTTSKKSGASFELSSGHDLRLGASTKIRVGKGQFFLEQGRVYVDSGASGVSEALAIRTRIGTMREFGTQYIVSSSDDAVEVRVREGLVEFHQISGAIDSVEPGVSLRVNSDGSIVREEIPLFGASWGWISVLSPTLDLKGMTLSRFFDWSSRENGWEFEFANQDLEFQASTIRLQGLIKNMTGEEALTSVLTTVGWYYEVSGGMIYVDLAGANGK